ncbi:uncharacterized protein LOC128730462, partial [Anopheles nili]|uniref:uncharacterized protein LOC128730462 n=1 Tax=Anopheles nili TaxID=185578 RepID=UPI00237A71ED
PQNRAQSTGLSCDPVEQEELLPQCKVKRNYTCGSCSYCTQNPRSYLTHLRDAHGEKISINECKRCLYASRHYQKLVRHMKMVHGACVEREKVSSPNRRQRKTFKKSFSKQLKREGTGCRTLGSLLPLEPETLNAINSAGTEQLVASPLPSLLKEIESSWTSTVLANIDLFQAMFQSEMDNLNKAAISVNQDATQHIESEKKARKSPEGGCESVPKKRHRPIPNLIPLTPASAVATRPEKELLKPVPMSSLMPQDVAIASKQTGMEPATSLASNRVSMSLDSQTKCTFCELTFESMIDLANHIATAHKEDLITSLLQKSMDDSNQNLFPQSDTDSVSNELWKSLLEANLYNTDVGVRNSTEPDGKPHTKDDDDVEVLENKSETYCGVETAPGYGEVTSTIPATDGTTSAVMKKVFKCPHCSFWASTASRFHVHIVGHLNKKPFECSLCSYRSNWRWDITKHIRLKTLRDPNHKNADVLMNDETGRRNYTKYNKYIALMQITDNSSRESSSYAKSFAESSVSDLMATCSTYNIDLNAFASMPEFKLLMEDKQTNDKTEPADEGLQLKCQLCEHRSSSKEELLVHVANQHVGLEAAHQPDDAAESEPGIVEQLQVKNSTKTTNISTPASTPTPPAMSFCSLSKSAANPSNGSPTNGILTGSGAGDKTTPVEPGDSRGDGESGSHKVIVPSTWRHNAPYRCGHCRQVSNWKHVIQRHCRLKHNGHVFIEHVNAEKDEPSDGEGHGHRSNKQNQHSSVYIIDEVLHPTTTGADNSRKSIEALVTTSIPPPLAPFSMDEVSCSANTLEPIVEIFDKDPTDLIGFNGSVIPGTVLVNSGTAAPAVSSEQLECISCQFRAETVDQLTEHLQEHMRNEQEEGSHGFDAAGLLDPVPTTMYYCHQCPARFFTESHIVEHRTKHSATAGGSCPVCTYTTTSEDERNRHKEVHSAAYNINTENLQIFLAESKEYPKPLLASKETEGEQIFIVEMPLKSPVRSRETTPHKKPRRSKQPVRSATNSIDGADEQLKSIFLCEYCDQTFDAEPDLNSHIKKHFSSILSPQGVAYYASLSNALNKDKKLELTISGAQASGALRYVYDNARSKDWSVYSKTDSVLLKL